MTQKRKSIGRQRREAIKALLAELVIEHQHIQQRPYTALELRLDRTGAPALFGKGFAKVCHPDVWDAEYGYELAFQKALADITRQLIAEHDTILELKDCLRRFPESSPSLEPGELAVLILDVPDMGDLLKGGVLGPGSDITWKRYDTHEA